MSYQKEFRTASGIELRSFYEQVYTPDSKPGEYPYTRGIYPEMYRARLWTMRQYAGYGSAEETNARFKYLLSNGQTGLSVAFDLPTQMGYDSDHPLAAGEVGKVGVAISSLEDMERLFDGIPLDKVSTSMTINAPAAILLLMYEIVAEKQGVSPEQLSGTIQNDILKEYVARGTYIFPPEPSMRLITDTFAYCRQHLPKWNPISISGYHIREAGATAVQEVAFTLANAIAYCERALEAGLKIDDFAPRLSFFFVADSDFFEEVAKFRAARRVWAKIVKERFGAKNSRSMQLRFHCQTSGASLTAQQPLNNIVRVAYQAMSAILGGAQSLHTNAYDEALALPTAESARLALRTQQILAYETGVTSVVDPLGGSYFVEHLTEEIENRVWSLLDEVENLGGAVRAIETGWMQSQIHESAYARQLAMESQERVVVGVNKFQTDEEERVETLRVNEELEYKQKQRLKDLRNRRDTSQVEEALSEIRRVAASQDNLLPVIKKAVASYATVGEICDALRSVFGEYNPPY